jgi:hypothetical protein
MHRVLILLPLLLALAGPAAVSASSAPAVVRTASAGTSTGHASAQFARFGGGSRGLFGGSSRSRGGGLFGGSRRRGLFGNRGRSRGLFSRIARALAFAYILHLLFSHGGLSILVWIGLIALIVSFTRRRRRRRMAY